MSLLAKAREGGPHYIYSIVTGYPGSARRTCRRTTFRKTPPGYYNHDPYFANLNISMPPPLVSDGQVTYADGTPATVDQMAKDASAFLMWAAEPKLENRHRAGIAVMVFLIIATVLGLHVLSQHLGGRSTGPCRTLAIEMKTAPSGQPGGPLSVRCLIIR